MAEPDHVTGLEPRGSLEAFFARCNDTPAPLALVMCDVVGLKNVNEQQGFAAGDDCLRQAADRLRAAAGEAAILARLGGDELVAVFTGPRASTAADDAVTHLAAVASPPLRAGAIVRKRDETCGATIDRLYAIVRRS
jgi:diguanylate cyclase (GGDEF)-like protein